MATLPPPPEFDLPAHPIDLEPEESIVDIKHEDDSVVEHPEAPPAKRAKRSPSPPKPFYALFLSNLQRYPDRSREEVLEMTEELWGNLTTEEKRAQHTEYSEKLAIHRSENPLPIMRLDLEVTTARTRHVLSCVPEFPMLTSEAVIGLSRATVRANRIDHAFSHPFSVLLLFVFKELFLQRLCQDSSNSANLSARKTLRQVDLDTVMSTEDRYHFMRVALYATPSSNTHFSFSHGPTGDPIGAAEAKESEQP